MAGRIFQEEREMTKDLRGLDGAEAGTMRPRRAGDGESSCFFTRVGHETLLPHRSFSEISATLTDAFGINGPKTETIRKDSETSEKHFHHWLPVLISHNILLPLFKCCLPLPATNSCPPKMLFPSEREKQNSRSNTAQRL